MFLDACAIIYLIEGNDEKSNRIRQLVSDYLDKRRCYICFKFVNFRMLGFAKKAE